MLQVIYKFQEAKDSNYMKYKSSSDLTHKPFIDIYLSTMLDHPRYIKWMSTLKPQIFKSRVARTA